MGRLGFQHCTVQKNSLHEHIFFVLLIYFCLSTSDYVLLKYFFKPHDFILTFLTHIFGHLCRFFLIPTMGFFCYCLNLLLFVYVLTQIFSRFLLYVLNTMKNCLSVTGVHQGTC